MPTAHARSALLIALAGFLSLAFGDALVKSMAGDWPAPAVSALRYAFGALGLAAYVALRHGRSGFVMPMKWVQVGRGGAVALATLCFFMGVMAMPLADATAIQFTSPIMTALLAPLVLGERTRPQTWAATLLAFAGVLVVLRPNLVEIGPAALFPIGAAFGMSWLMMLNRMSAGAAPVMVMQFLVAAVAAPILVAAAVTLHWAGLEIGRPGPEVVLKCLAVACLATAGHSLIFAAVERASASTVAPMTYVQLLVAAGLGWLWFGDRPDVATFVGAALIILGGLLLWRAQRPGGMPAVAGTPDWDWAGGRRPGPTAREEGWDEKISDGRGGDTFPDGFQPHPRRPAVLAERPLGSRGKGPVVLDGGELARPRRRDGRSGDKRIGGSDEKL